MDLSYERVARWLPEPLDPQTIENWIGNYGLYPGVLPVTLSELYLAQAVARERLANMSTELKNQTNNIDWNDVLNDLRKISRSNRELVLLVLDGFQPSGITEIQDLATVVCPTGLITPGKKVAMEILVDLGLTEKQKIIVPPDEILLLPIPGGQKAKLKIRMFGNFRINKKSGLTVEVSGGSAGIVIDTRGRPLTMPLPDSKGRERIKKWRGEMGQ